MNKDSGNREGIITKIARFLKYHKFFVLFLVFLILVIYFFVFSNNGFLMRVKLESEKKQLEKQLETELKKQDSLKSKIMEIQTSNQELERIAREKYGMTKEGEKIYKILVDSTK